MSLIEEAKNQLREEFKAMVPILVRQEVKKELERLGYPADSPATKKTAAPSTTPAAGKKSTGAAGASQPASKVQTPQGEVEVDF